MCDNGYTGESRGLFISDNGRTELKSSIDSLVPVLPSVPKYSLSLLSNCTVLLRGEGRRSGISMPSPPPAEFVEMAIPLFPVLALLAPPNNNLKGTGTRLLLKLPPRTTFSPPSSLPLALAPRLVSLALMLPSGPKPFEMEVKDESGMIGLGRSG